MIPPKAGKKQMIKISNKVDARVENAVNVKGDDLA